MKINTGNNKGNIGIAVVVMLIAFVSGITMASISYQDSHHFRLQLDAIQQFHLLRSEVGRARFVAGHFETLDTPPVQTVLPTRPVEIEFGTQKTTYFAKTKLNLVTEVDATGYLIKSLIRAVRGTGSLNNKEILSPVARYGENRIRSLLTIALYHYFSDIDRHIDDVPGGIVFWSGDVIHGRVHSNTDIYMRQNDWPKFYGLVSTAGMVRVSPGGGTAYPREQIFLGPPPGLIENYPRIAFEPTADLVRRNGIQLFGGASRDDAIAYVTVESTSYDLWQGEIKVEDPVREWIEGYNQFTIYETYPPYGPVGDSIGVNRIPRKDTLWKFVTSGTVSNRSIFVPMQLWISGKFAGRQTWGCSHDIYLKGDLTYSSTPPGQRPDGYDAQGNPTLPVNRSDYLGVISEQCIFIQYGHWDPIDSMRVRPNTESIYMYGAYCAVGQGEQGRPWEDGRITAQYLYPKGSTPPQYWRGERFNYIDLHMFNYPTTTIRPWPSGLDYPWYNPLWPEPGPIYNVPNLPSWTPNPHDAPEVVNLRGDVWLFGSFAQRRRGAVGVLNSGGVILYQWNPNGEINPNITPEYGAVPPGRTGYEKRYHTDYRFEKTGPPDYPVVRFVGYETDDLKDLGYLTSSWYFKKPPANF